MKNRMEARLARGSDAFTDYAYGHEDGKTDKLSVFVDLFTDLKHFEEAQGTWRGADYY